MSEQSAIAAPDTEKANPHLGQAFQVDRFKGIEPGGWGIEWKAGKRRMVLLCLGDVAKAGKQLRPFDLDAALTKLGYVKATVFEDLVAIAEMMPEFNNPAESDAFASLMIAKEVLSDVRKSSLAPVPTPGGADADHR